MILRIKLPNRSRSPIPVNRYFIRPAPHFEEQNLSENPEVHLPNEAWEVDRKGPASSFPDGNWPVYGPE
jgi:hypothetical protein